MRHPEGKQGAGRFGYLDYPEPVTAADRNFNRGVDAQEFERAADERFALLDANRDGKITPGELPRLAGGMGGGPGGRQPLPPRDGDRSPED
jgi:Ca2+-binding EF-hand superfamily protein